MLGSPEVQLQPPNQPEDWRAFYTRAINYLEALNIDAKETNDHETSWKQLKMMFEGKDRQTLQTLINNGTIILESQKMPWHVLDTIATTVKSKDHFWNFWDKLLSDIHQLPNKGIHVLNTRITTLINQSKFLHNKTKETLKITMKPWTGSGSKTSPS